MIVVDILLQSELRKILTEMGSEPLEPEEADDVINEINFYENGTISQEVFVGKFGGCVH
jgi:Ca2+-binding EF-hand superfamily protein